MKRFTWFSLSLGKFAFMALAMMAVLVFSLLLNAPSAQAAVPTTINFQGRLANASGVTMANGSYNMRFRIHTAPTGGTLLWTETRETTNRVVVTNGLFTVQLGSVTPLTASIFNNASTLYFEIELPTPGTATCSTASCQTWTEGAMTPRSVIAASAYAMNAATLDGVAASGFVQSSSNATGDLLVGTAGNTWGKLAIGGNGTCLTSNGTTASWGGCGGSTATLQGVYDGDTDGGDAILALTATDGGVVLRDAATPLATAFAVQNSTGTAAYFNVSSSSVVMQDSSGNSALLFDSTTSELKVYENVASPTRHARVYFDTATNSAVFAASSGVTQIGAAGTGGDINMTLSGAANDKLNATKTFTSAGGYSGSDFNFTRNLTGTAYALTGNLMKIEDTSTFTGGSSSPNLLYINQANTGATGNLILAQTGTVDKFKVDVGGNVTASGAITGTGLTTTTGGVTIASGASYTGAGAVTVSSATGSDLTLTASSAARILLDSANSRVTIGTADTTGTLLVLDTKTSAGDPTGTNGGMYYNSNAGRFRCYENGAWTDCLSSSAYIVKGTAENVYNSVALQDDDELQFTIPAGQKWTYEFRLLVMNTNSNAPDWKAAILATGAASCRATQSGSEPVGAVFLQATTTDCTTPGLLVNNNINADASIPYNVSIQGVVTAGASDTVVKLQWAHNTAARFNLTVLDGSYVTAQKVGGSR